MDKFTLIKYLFLINALLIVMPRAANAYIDPGSGSFIFQLMIGAALGGLVTLKVYYRSVKCWVARMLTRDKKDSVDKLKL